MINHNLNPKVIIKKREKLSNKHFSLENVTFSYENKDGIEQTQQREVFDRGNGATILLYNQVKKSVILTYQFRIPTLFNGNSTGMLLESCAGTLDEINPKDCIIRETLEETGYSIINATQIFEAYMVPGSVTEKIYFFVAQYDDSMKVSQGGGLVDEGEEIEVIEIQFSDAIKMLREGKIQDAKTIILLQYAMIHNLID